MSSLVEINMPTPLRNRRALLRLIEDDISDHALNSKHGQRLFRSAPRRASETLLPVQNANGLQPSDASTTDSSDRDLNNSPEGPDATSTYYGPIALSCGPQTRKFLISEYVLRNVIQPPYLQWSREMMMKAFMVWHLNLACSHRPRDLVFVEEDSTFIMHEDLWRRAEVEAKQRADAELGPYQKLASQHMDTGWVVVCVKERARCEVCKKRWNNGKVYAQMKDEEGYMWERISCYKCIGLTDADTGGVRRLVYRSRQPNQNPLRWQTEEKISIEKEEYNPRPYDRLAQEGML